jgi:hypothetical protein
MVELPLYVVLVMGNANVALAMHPAWSSISDTMTSHARGTSSSVA